MDDRLKKKLLVKRLITILYLEYGWPFLWIQTVYIDVMGGDSCSCCSGGPKNEINLLDKTGLKASKRVARME
jgi:hypothetical protein